MYARYVNINERQVDKMAEENQQEEFPLFDLSEQFSSEEVPIKEQEPQQPEKKTLKKPEKKKRRNISKMAIFLCSLGSLAAGIYGGYMIGKNQHEVTDPNVIKIIQAYNIIKEKWLFGKDIEDLDNVLTDMMINGLLDNGDPFTFYTPSMEDQNLDVDGEGLGIRSFNCPEGMFLTDVFTSGSFYKAGAREGDILVSVEQDGEVHSLVGLNNSDISKLLKDKTAKDAKYTLLHPNADGSREEIVITAKKDKFVQDVAELISDTIDDSGKRVVVLRINTFLGDPFTIVKQILDEKTTDNKGKIEKLIFDLRDNGGGYVDQATTMAALFAPKGATIMSVKDKNDEVIQKYVQKGNPRYTISDIRIIQNGSSASASETFALSLIQNNKAKVYGHQSYGKGIVQSFFTFADRSVIRYTYGQVYGPDGTTTIQKVGITPDVPSTYTEVSTARYEFIEDNSEYRIIAEEQLKYLGFTSGDLTEKIKKFQTTYGYPEEGLVNLTLSHQLNYQVHLLDQTNRTNEIKHTIAD